MIVLRSFSAVGIASVLALAVSCTTVRPLGEAEAADRIRGSIYAGMSKAQVRRVLGEPRRLGPTALRARDLAGRTVAESESAAECWLWGDSTVLRPDVAVCFSGGVAGTVLSKSP